MLIWKYNPLMGLVLINIIFPLLSPLSLSLWLSKSSSLSSWFLCPSLTWPTWGGSGPLDPCVRVAAYGLGLKFWHLHNHWRSSQVGNMVGAYILSGRWSLALLSWFPIWSSVCATSTLSASFETPGNISTALLTYVPDFCHFPTLTHFYGQFCLTSHLCLAGKHF